MRSLQVELLEQLAALTVRPVERRQPAVLEHVEDRVGNTDAATSVQHPLADTREARKPILSKGDELAV
jgi:hypothetical protein